VEEPKLGRKKNTYGLCIWRYTCGFTERLKPITISNNLNSLLILPKIGFTCSSVVNAVDIHCLVLMRLVHFSRGSRVMSKIFCLAEYLQQCNMIPSRGLRWSSQTIGIGRRRLNTHCARQVQLFYL
jgi:hypothetical protein